jgi:hypothetical protein
MFDIDKILMQVEEQNVFKIEVQEDIPETGKIEMIKRPKTKEKKSGVAIEEVEKEEVKETHNWSFSVRRPTPRQAREWSRVLYSQLADFFNSDMDMEGKGMKTLAGGRILKDLESFWPVVEGLCSIAISWEGVSGDFSREKLLKYFEIYPVKAVFIAFGFLGQYQTWIEGLKKS